MLKNMEEGISYSLITSIYFPLLLNKLNHKVKKKKIRKQVVCLMITWAQIMNSYFS